jgi:hypothetical protein
VSYVNNMQEQIGLRQLFEGRPEGSDDSSWQLLNKAHRIGNQRSRTVRQNELTRGGVEGSEQLVLNQNVSMAESIEEGAFPRICIANYSDYGDSLATAMTPVEGAMLPHLLDLCLEMADPLANQASVRLQLRLARAPGTDATA